MIKKISLILLVVFSVGLFAQNNPTPNLWKTLANVRFAKVLDKEYGYHVSYPVFSEEIKALDGQEVIVKGYIIPLEEELGYFAFSAFPYQNCFFCGNAGMETVMEVYAKEELDYTPKAIRIKGKLKLNNEDMIDHLMYILEDAEIVD
jgi:hypothetical protein